MRVRWVGWRPIGRSTVPPAVITFTGAATVLEMDELDAESRTALLRGVGDMEDTVVIRIDPVGRFVTYGIGIPMMQMRSPEKALARVPV